MAHVSAQPTYALAPHVTGTNRRKRRSLASAVGPTEDSGRWGAMLSRPVRGVVALAGSALLCSSVPSAASISPVPDRSIPFSEVASHDNGATTFSDV